MFNFNVSTDLIFRAMLQSLLQDDENHRNLISVSNNGKKVLEIKRDGVGVTQSPPITHNFNVAPFKNGAVDGIVLQELDLVCAVVENHLRALNEFAKEQGALFSYEIERYSWQSRDNAFLIKVPSGKEKGFVYVVATRLNAYTFAEFPHTASVWDEKEKATKWLEANKDGPLLTGAEVVAMGDVK